MAVQHVAKDGVDGSKSFVKFDLIPEDNVVQLIDADEYVDWSTSEVISHLFRKLKRVGIVAVG